MLRILDTIARFTANRSAAPRESLPAGNGLHRPFSEPAGPATLPPDRRGRLKNGNRSGDFLAARRCGARTRCGGACRQPAMPNRRCRMHGGLSTGPRTPEGLARSRRARLTHGGYSAHVRALRAEARAHGRRVRALVALMRARSAGHGVDRSKSPIPTPVLVIPRIHHRDHRGHGGSNPPAARPAHNPPSSVPSVSSLVDSSPAGHGLHPSFLQSRLSPRAQRLLGSVAPLAGFSAGHGLHPSFFATRAALR